MIRYRENRVIFKKAVFNYEKNALLYFFLKHTDKGLYAKYQDMSPSKNFEKMGMFF